MQAEHMQRPVREFAGHDFVQLPQTMPLGDLPIQISQGGFQSPTGVLINVQ